MPKSDQIKQRLDKMKQQLREVNDKLANVDVKQKQMVTEIDALQAKYEADVAKVRDKYADTMGKEQADLKYQRRQLQEDIATNETYYNTLLREEQSEESKKSLESRMLGLNDD